MSVTATLYRMADCEFGVFGHLTLTDASGTRLGWWCTAEDDWLDNAPGKSCIPAGRYVCQRTIYHKHHVPAFEITGVPNRSRILIHAGNTEEDVEGCVLLGKAFGAVPVQDEDDPTQPTTLKWAVTQSKLAVAEFMGCLVGVQSFPLDIVWAAPGSWRAA